MTLTNELQKSILSDKDLCFPVSQLPIGYLDQDKQWHRIGNKYAIVNQKTGETVSVVSHDYEVVPNEMILKIIEGSLMALRLKFKSSGVVFRGGAKFKGIYIIDNPVEIISGDTLSPVIQVECSYDAVSKNRILLGAYRHVCLNLCVSGGTDWGGFSAIHRGNINDAIAQTVPGILDMLESFPQKTKIFSRWAKEELKDSDRDEMYKHLLQFTGMKKHALAIYDRWMTGPRTIWEAYNDGTYYGSHNCRTALTSMKVNEIVNKTFFNRFANN